MIWTAIWLYILFTHFHYAACYSESSPSADWRLSENPALWIKLVENLYEDRYVKSFGKRTGERFAGKMLGNNLLEKGNKRGRELFGKRSNEQLAENIDSQTANSFPTKDLTAYKKTIDAVSADSRDTEIEIFKTDIIIHNERLTEVQAQCDYITQG
ncbi:unnamed protein product [Thelazia callipaeda]|uniref:Uncharacterized protein n=1 Tax=Thelazia callipaeda TaxID=103827 RepID=A0A0N5D1Z8_THECL|nr:unnamed protein product [Thelazia callipaeda]